MSENGTETAPQETNSTSADATINETDQTTEQTSQDITPDTTDITQPSESAENAEDVSYHTVEKEGKVTAIWEMQGRKHIRTIDPRSNEGKQILELFETAA
ncbi:MAG: hypothetical protein H0T08_07290 [Acidobacteria bacterium]|jgi:hypothetical protein|nr:hypothetical protein [Acidobacteriota bacterium]